MDMVKVVVTRVLAKNSADTGNIMKKPIISPPFPQCTGENRLALLRNFIRDHPVTHN